MEQRQTGFPIAAIPPIPPRAIIAGAALITIVAAHLLASGRIKYGAALFLVALYGPLVFFDLAAAFAVWVGVLFVQDLHSLSIAPNSMGVLVALGWLGAFAARAGRLRVLREHRRLIVGTIVFLIWMTVSAAWAHNPGRAESQAGFWWLSGLALLITMTALTDRRDVGIVVIAFVAGATVAAVIGLAGGGLYTASTAIGATSNQGRLTGGGGDPNVQAAAFVAAMFLTMGLFSVYHHAVARLMLLISFVLVTVAFFATQSRGGLIALGIATVAALVLASGQRSRIMAMVGLGAVIAVVAIAVQPGALGRITNFGGGTSGRSDIWRVATKLWEQHPLVGIGTNNFEIAEPQFARKIPNVSRVTYIAEKPDPAHNSYLQVLVENGAIGLLMWLAVLVACLRAGWLAAREFDRTGLRAYGDLARAVLMGTIGMLSAIFFITDNTDWRLWVLLGLGPALLSLARHGPLRPPSAS
ncbi:MAG TPA: O-antigen ligase family protein [Solirubrobacteraceae bacterium]